MSYSYDRVLLELHSKFSVLKQLSPLMQDAKDGESNHEGKKDRRRGGVLAFVARRWMRPETGWNRYIFKLMNAPSSVTVASH